MTVREKFLAFGLVLAAFLVGKLSSGVPAVAAQGSTPQVSVRQVGPDSAMVIYYPDQNKVYVYPSPFVGSPEAACGYSFTLRGPGEQLKRETCQMRR